MVYCHILKLLTMKIALDLIASNCHKNELDKSSNMFPTEYTKNLID